VIIKNKKASSSSPAMKNKSAKPFNKQDHKSPNGEKASTSHSGDRQSKSQSGDKMLKSHSRSDGTGTSKQSFKPHHHKAKRNVKKPLTPAERKALKPHFKLVSACVS